MVTCTPIGVNTDRLLVTGVRAPVPQSIPAASTQRDGTLIAVGVGVAVFALALAAAIVVRRRSWCGGERSAGMARVLAEHA